MKKIFVLFLLYVGIQALSFSQVKVDVLWNGTWFPATVLESKESSWKIHYDGYGSEWDEWVTADRIKIAAKKGDKVQVLWNGTWYKAEVLEVSGVRCKIHYDGYGSEWDEYVTLDRMK